MSRHAAPQPTVPLAADQRVRVTWDRQEREGTVLYEQSPGIYRVQIDGGCCAVTGKPMSSVIPARYLQAI